MQEKLILFGGTGFVGFNVLQKALSRGYKVVVATRHGAPGPHTRLENMVKRVMASGSFAAARETIPGAIIPNCPPEELHSKEFLKFVKVDATSRTQVLDIMREHPDATMLISCIGLLSLNYDQAMSINGEANLNILNSIYDSKLLPRLRKFVYVSAEPFNEYCPAVFGNQRLLKGYFEGKQRVERVVLDELKNSGVVLRPGFIYGTRDVTLPLTQKVLPLPLGLPGYPFHCLLKGLKGSKLLTPPVSVEVVAETAIRACAWASLPALNFSGLVDVYKMLEMCAKTDPILQNKDEPTKTTRKGK